MSNKTEQDELESVARHESWEARVPREIRDDSLWKMKAYRLALFLGDIAWRDCKDLLKDPRTKASTDQLYRAVGSVGANLEEGYSKSSGKDRARYFEYALGSARESRGWYYRVRFALKPVVVAHRLQLLTQIIRLLIKMIPQQRQGKGWKMNATERVEEEVPIYGAAEGVGKRKTRGRVRSAKPRKQLRTERA